MNSKSIHDMDDQRLKLIKRKIVQTVKLIENERDFTIDSNEKSILHDASLAVATAGTMIFNLIESRKPIRKSSKRTR